MWKHVSRVLPLLCLIALPLSWATAERINHEGRILGDPAPPLVAPILFNTPEADAILSTMQIMPRDNAWNERVDTRPLLSNSATMITQINADLASGRRNLRMFAEMNFALIPDNQPTQPIAFLLYANQSDLDGGTSPNGLYPIPSILPIESWPVDTGTLTLDQWQQDSTNLGGDRHAIMVKPGAGVAWETWQAKRVGTAWHASNGAKFDLNSNALRPAGWTSGDAGGLSMFAALVRFDECARGMVEHAVRIVVQRSRQSYIYPATHQAGSTTLPDVPAMGQRLRLRASFVIPASWSTYEKAIARALQKYGAIVADNGNFFSISYAPDQRFPSNAFSNIQTLLVTDFEVVQTTDATSGPRSPGAPSANAGPDRAVTFGQAASLSAAYTSPTGTPTLRWRLYGGPGTVTFADATSAITSATFSAPGRYTLMFSADDGVHSPAYDAVVVNVAPGTNLQQSGSDIIVRFASSLGQAYRVERSDDVALTLWTIVGDNLPGTGAFVPVTDPGAAAIPRRFYRVTVLP